MSTKICATCKKEKLVTEFNKRSVYKDGLYVKCRDCEKERRTYQIAKLDQWLQIKKRAKKDSVPLLFTQQEFYMYLKENIEAFREVADENKTPYVVRIDDTLPYKLSNLKVVGTLRLAREIIARHVETGEVLEFPTTKAAFAQGFGKKQISDALKFNTVYKGYKWERKGELLQNQDDS